MDSSYRRAGIGKSDIGSKHPVGGSYRIQIGAAGEIRTPDNLVRSQVLYPAELRPHA